MLSRRIICITQIETHFKTPLVVRPLNWVLASRRHFLSTNNKASQNGELIYTGVLTSSLKRAKFISLSSSVFGLAVVPSVYNSIKSSSILFKVMSFSMASIFIFITPLLFQYVARKYVTKLYYDYEREQFTACLFNFFLMSYELKFSLSDVQIPQTALGPFTTIVIKSKNRPLFINLEYIQDKELLYKMHGYEKPVEQAQQPHDDDDD